LIIEVMSYQQTLVPLQYGLECLVTALPRDILKTRPSGSVHMQVFHMQGNAEGCTDATTVCLPVICVRTQAVLDMNSTQRASLTMAQRGMGSVQKDNRIQTSTASHREATARGVPGKLLTQGLDSE